MITGRCPAWGHYIIFCSRRAGTASQGQGGRAFKKPGDVVTFARKWVTFYVAGTQISLNCFAYLIVFKRVVFGFPNIISDLFRPVKGQLGQFTHCHNIVTKAGVY